MSSWRPFYRSALPALRCFDDIVGTGCECPHEQIDAMQRSRSLLAGRHRPILRNALPGGWGPLLGSSRHIDRRTKTFFRAQLGSPVVVAMESTNAPTGLKLEWKDE